jgi:hypothetical protein
MQAVLPRESNPSTFSLVSERDENIIVVHQEPGDPAPEDEDVKLKVKALVTEFRVPQATGLLEQALVNGPRISWYGQKRTGVEDACSRMGVFAKRTTPPFHVEDPQPCDEPNNCNS